MKEYQTYQLAAFIERTSFQTLQYETVQQVKKHLLDSIGSLLFATGAPLIKKLMEQVKMMGEGGHCRIPDGSRVAADRAAQVYTALTRYPDFMDNFLGKEATCHPSDNIGGLLAAQLTDASGKDFLLAMALAYEIECRLVQEIPVMIKGFDHTALLGYSLTAGLCRLLQLDKDQTASALGMAGCSFNPLVTSRAAYTSEWKGLASSLVAMGCLNMVMLAKAGVTGPVALFEGPKGFKEVFDMSLDYDWRKEDFSLIQKCILKIFNAEVHTQPSIEAALALKTQHKFAVQNIDSIDVTTFLTAYHITGCGSYGDRKKDVHSKEQADHSLPYVIAVALLDGKVYPGQLTPERIQKTDVQDLLQKITVDTAVPFHKPLKLAGMLDPYTLAYPDKVKTKVEITFKDGKKISTEQDDYHGFFTRPLSWEDTVYKFNELGKRYPEAQRQQIISCIAGLEKRNISELIDLLTDPNAPTEAIHGKESPKQELSSAR